MSKISGQVAEILNVRELVLNRGTNHGVEVGMRFAILNRRGINIVDPESGEDLGSVEVPKTVVKVVRAYERVAVARTFRTFRVRGGPFSVVGFESLSAPARTVVETLRTSESQAVAEMDEEDSLVKVGDPAVQQIGDEFDEEAQQPSK